VEIAVGGITTIIIKDGITYRIINSGTVNNNNNNKIKITAMMGGVTVIMEIMDGETMQIVMDGETTIMAGAVIIRIIGAIMQE
jgi:hypothetical protein